LLGPVSRPVLSIGDGSDAASLERKRYRRRKLEELERLGSIELRTLDVPEFKSVIDEVIDLYDFRQGATHYDTLPFRGDPHRRRFYLEMATAGLLHATAMRVGGKLASACILPPLPCPGQPHVRDPERNRDRKTATHRAPRPVR
jgi:hypothetical protein